MKYVSVLLLFALALPAQSPAGRILRIQISTVSNQPIVGATVVAQTQQEEKSGPGGLTVLHLPPEFGPGSELKISVTYQDLVIHIPLNGDLTVPKDPNKVVPVRLGPKGDAALLANSAPQIVKASIRQQDTPSATSTKDQQEPKLTRYIRQWAAQYGFGVEQVQAEVRRWADEVEHKRADSSLEDQALAAYANKEFEKAAALFKEVAASALPRFEEARKRRAAADEEERKELRAYLDGAIGQADALQRSFRYSEARIALDEAFHQVDKGRYRPWWIEMMIRRANSSEEEGEFGAAKTSGERFAAAILDHRQLLQELTGASDRQNWAMTQNNMGNALRSQGQRSGVAQATALLGQAVEAYSAALQVYTKADLPQDWAMTQNNLGVALVSQGERSGGPEATALLGQAVAAYRAALQVYTKADLPQDWAMIQNNLGLALRGQGERSGGAEATALLGQAVVAHRAALQVYTKADLPQDWAMIQNNLGIALRSQSERSGGAEATALLGQAVEAYSAALQVYTKSVLPQDWAATQNNLGFALQRKGERSGGAEATALLGQAVEAYRAALQVYTKADLPQGWAMTQNNLGIALQRQGDWIGAAEATEHVLEIYPDNARVLAEAEGIYHEHLFSFARAFELNRHRVDLDGSVAARLDFAEKHLTTGRYRECVDRWNQFSPDELKGELLIDRESLRFACQYAAKDNAAAHSAETLLTMTDSLQKVQWSFAGTKHFLSTSPAFANTRNSWIKLFESLESGSSPGVAEAVREIQKTQGN